MDLAGQTSISGAADTASEPPVETLNDIAMRFVDLDLQITTVRIGLDLDLFSLLSENQAPMSVNEIAEARSADPMLLARLLRYMSSHQYIKQTDKDHYTANSFTKNLTDPNLRGFFYFHFNLSHPLTSVLPDYLKKNNYHYDPNGKLPWHEVFETNLDFFRWIQQRPDELGWFLGAMSVPSDEDWLNVFPLAELSRTALEADPERTVLVDVGGNAGAESARLTQRIPELRGHVVLQDLEETVGNAPHIDGVEPMAHDFFTPQKVKGAKFYYLRRILHDWTDDKALEILQNMVPAMAADSHILIDEIVLPNVNPPRLATSLDLRIYTITGSRERTVDEWHNLLGQVGLEILQIKTYKLALSTSIIMAGLKASSE